MSRNGRILVGLDGRAPDVHVLRYAAMIANLGQAALVAGAPTLHRAETAARSAVQLGSGDSPTCVADVALPTGRGSRYVQWSAAQGQPEVRFLSMWSAGTRDNAPRAELARLVHEYLANSTDRSTVTCDMLKRRPLERLPALAADFDADVLLVDRAFGSCRKLARLVVTAPCPVWLTPSGCAPVLRQIIVPIDFSAGSRVCLQRAIELASRFRPARCVALHVVEFETRFDCETVAPQRRRELDHKFETLVSGLDPRGVYIEPVFVMGGDLVRAVERFARKHATDLVVMTARRRGRLAGLLERSQAQRLILGYRGPLLVLPSPDKPLGAWEALAKRWHRSELPQFS